MQMIAEKLIWMLGLNPERIKRDLRKISQIHRNDHIAMAHDGRRKNAAIVRIWKLERWDQAFIAGDQGIACMGIHKIARTFQSGALAMRLIGQKGFDPFAVDVSRPSGLIDISHCELQEQVADWGWIQYVGVEQRRVVAHGRE